MKKITIVELEAMTFNEIMEAYSKHCLTSGNNPEEFLKEMPIIHKKFLKEFWKIHENLNDKAWKAYKKLQERI